MLTARQRDLLEIIINEFMQTAEAVGSIELPEKYELRVSPATIRNEMARLVALGYLQKPHSSSGRVPTTQAYKYFLQNILDEFEELDIRKQTVFSEDLFQKRYNQDQLLISAVRALNEITGNTAIALINDKIYHSGLYSLLEEPEFRDIDKLKQILSILEDYSELSSILSRCKSDDDIKILIGEETGYSILDDTAIVFANIPTFQNRDGYIAIFGPNRMNYKKVIPSIKYVSKTISDVLKDWQIKRDF